MKIKFGVKGLNIQIPEVDASVIVDAVKYELDEVTPQELSDAFSSLVGNVIAHVSPFFPEFAEPVSFRDVNSGDEGHTPIFSIGDYVEEHDEVAGTVIAVNDDSVTFIVQEVANPRNAEYLGNETIGYFENVNHIAKGALSKGPTTAPATPFPTDIDENVELPFDVKRMEDAVETAKNFPNGKKAEVVFDSEEYLKSRAEREEQERAEREERERSEIMNVLSKS